MAIDIAAGVIVLGFGYLGWRAGVAHQLLTLVELAAAFALALVVGYPTALFYYGKVANSTPLGAVVLWFTIILSVSWLLFVFFSRRFLSDVRYIDSDRALHLRALGGLVGAFKGLLLAYIVVAVLIARAHDGSGPFLPYDESVVGRFALEHNPIVSNGKRLADRQGEYLDLDKTEQFEDSSFERFQ